MVDKEKSSSQFVELFRQLPSWMVISLGALTLAFLLLAIIAFARFITFAPTQSASRTIQSFTGNFDPQHYTDSAYVSVSGKTWRVIDINETRIQYGEFITSKSPGWTEVKFPKPFGSGPISVSVSLKERPNQLFASIVGNVSRDSFEFMCGIEESDPIFTAMRPNEMGKSAFTSKIKTVLPNYVKFNEATKTSQYPQLDWQFSLWGIGATYIAFGEKSD